MNENKKLQDILKTMNVPEKRKTDYRWLLRNLGIQNGSHPQFPVAMDMIKKLVKGERPMQSLSYVIRLAAGTMMDMKKIIEKDFKDLEKVPMKSWPKDRIEDFQTKVKKINEESRKNLFPKNASITLITRILMGIWKAEPVSQNTAKFLNLIKGEIKELISAYSPGEISKALDTATNGKVTMDMVKTGVPHNSNNSKGIRG